MAPTARHHKGILRQTPGDISFEHSIDRAAYVVNNLDSFRRYKCFQCSRHGFADQDLDLTAREDSQSTEHRGLVYLDFPSPDLLSALIFDDQQTPRNIEQRSDSSFDDGYCYDHRLA